MEASSPPQGLSPHQPARPSRGERFDARAQQLSIEDVFSRRSARNKIALLALAIVWASAFAYYTLMPASFTTKWSLILPTSNSSSSVTIDTIGQASTTPAQPFGTIQLSPKVIYREIATSEQVRNRAAESLMIPPRLFGKVRIKLVDETSLLFFQINGSSAEDARQRGRAVIQALEYQLDALRKDEQEKRAKIVRDNLQYYQASLDASTERILAFQRETGLQSLAQFTEASSSAELLRRKINDQRPEIERLSAEQARLIGRLGLQPSEAAAALKLAADPAFSRLATAFAEQAAQVNENSGVLGPNHPARVLAMSKAGSAYAELQRLAREAQVDPTIDLRRLVMPLNMSHQSDMMRMIVANDAVLTGRRKETTAAETELVRLETEVRRMGIHASRLVALKKDHLVAEAVLTSAMARLDTNRADLYSSYPLLQVLAEPDLPENPSQPQLWIAVAAGVAGNLLVTMAWMVSWVGGRFSTKRQRRRRARELAPALA